MRKIFNAFIIITLATIVLVVFFHIHSIKQNTIPNLNGTYQSINQVTINNSSVYLQLSFLSQNNKFYKLYDNNYIESGFYTKDTDYNNVYTGTQNNKHSIIIVENNYIYYIESSTVYKLELIISTPLIPNL